MVAVIVSLFIYIFGVAFNIKFMLLQMQEILRKYFSYYMNVIDNKDTLSSLLFLYKMDISLVCYMSSHCLINRTRDLGQRDLYSHFCLSSLRKPLVISIVIQLVDRMVDLRLSWGKRVLVSHFLFVYDTLLFCLKSQSKLIIMR